MGKGPTEQDKINAELRARVAAKQKREFEEAKAIVESVLGHGFFPIGRHFLVDHAEEELARAAGAPMTPMATVITAKNGKIVRHVAITDYNIRECADYSDGFGDMLTEPDPNRTAVVKGQRVSIHRYSLYWSGYEPGYTPRSAEQLAAAREKRERRAVEKEATESPLFADLIRQEGYVKKGDRNGP